MISYTKCPVCGSGSIHKVLTAQDHTVSHEQFEIWQCANCSVRFTQDIPDLHSIGAYYKSENYISHTDTKKGLVNRMYMFVRRFTLKSKRMLVERVTGIRKGRLLDVGAGTGAFLNEMKTAGWSVEGVEPDAETIKRAAAAHGLDLKTADYLFQLPAKSFDVITLWHVLEHVHALHEYFAQLKTLCTARGRIFIAVPNYTSYDAEIYGAHWAAYDVPRHLYHFSAASMQQLVALHGCHIESIHPMWLDSFYVSLLSEKYKTGHQHMLRAFWNGFQSNGKARAHHRKASSLIYVISVQEQTV